MPERLVSERVRVPYIEKQIAQTRDRLDRAVAQLAVVAGIAMFCFGLGMVATLAVSCAVGIIPYTLDQFFLLMAHRTDPVVTQ